MQYHKNLSFSSRDIRVHIFKATEFICPICINAKAQPVISFAKSSAEAKALGRQVRNFDDSIWNDQRFEIVVKGSLQKFGQHKDLKAFLLNTKDRVLVEASPVDRIWGIGLSADSVNAENPKNWPGLNLLGFALMEVRDILNNN